MKPLNSIGMTFSPPMKNARFNHLTENRYENVCNHTLTGFPDMAQASGRTDKIQSSFPKRTDLFKMQEMCTSECFSGLKIHTIRANYPLWLKRITEVQQGKAVLSVRQWSGKPYRSPQIEITRLTVKHGVDIQKVVLYRTEWYDDDNKCHYCYDVTLDNDKGINIDDIARNDGLNPIDFIEWFDRDICKQKLDDDGRVHKELAIIHFTKFRY